jgi:hypothetical protein
VRKAITVLAALICVALGSTAQPARSAAVFIEPGARATLVFVDLATGEEQSVQTDGSVFAVLNDSVMTYDPSTRSVVLIGADGRSRPHPFITLGAQDARVDWAISADGKRIAWTITQGGAGMLTTVTRVADVSGEAQRIVFEETRTDGLRARPVAFSPDDSILYLDYQPDGLDTLMLFPQFAGLFQLDLSAEHPGDTFAFLPGEPGDFTGAGFGSGYFLRLAVSQQAGGFDVRVVRLATGTEWSIPASNSGGYSIAGDVLVAPDGRFAVYAQTALSGLGSGSAQTSTVIMRVDLTEMTQTPLTVPQEGVLRPVAWTENDGAVLLISPNRAGTWKVRISDGRVQQVAQLTYLGQISET